MAYIRQNYTLYKRGKVWYYQTYAPDGTRTCGKSTGQTNKTCARNYCDDLLKHGLLYSGASQSFFTYASGFFDDNSVWVLDRLALGTEDRPGIADGTLNKYRRDLKNHLLPFFGKYKLQDITPTVVKKFRQYCLTEKELSSKSINNAMGTFHIITQAALADGLMMFDPMRGIKALKISTDVRNRFTLEEAKKIIQCRTWKHEDGHPTNLVACLTGMRRSEILGIRTETLHKTYIDCKDQLLEHKIKPLKTAEKRIIPIPEALYHLLKARCERNGGFAFTCYEQVPYNDLRAVMVLVGIDKQARKLTFHSWRHFANTYYLSKNIPKVKVNSIIGHTDDETKAQKMYTHFLPEDLEDFYKAQEELLHLVIGE